MGSASDASSLATRMALTPAGGADPSSKIEAHVYTRIVDRADRVFCTPTDGSGSVHELIALGMPQLTATIVRDTVASRPEQSASFRDAIINVSPPFKGGVSCICGMVCVQEEPASSRH